MALAVAISSKAFSRVGSGMYERFFNTDFVSAISVYLLRA